MKRTKKKCLNCNKEISLSNYKSHSLSCINKKEPLFTIPKEWKISDSLFKCGVCNKTFSMHGMISHYYRCHTNNGKEFIQKQKPWANVYKNNPHSWNSGKSKENNESLKKLSNSLKNRYKDGTIKAGFFGRTHSSETKRKLRQATIDYISLHCKNKNIGMCPRIGRYENDFFDYIQRYIKYPIKRNQLINHYFPDGFIEELLLTIEFNEPHHENNLLQIEHDKEKENNLKKVGILTINIRQIDWFLNKDFVVENLLFVINNREVNKGKKLCLTE